MFYNSIFLICSVKSGSFSLSSLTNNDFYVYTIRCNKCNNNEMLACKYK